VADPAAERLEFTCGLAASRTALKYVSSYMQFAFDVNEECDKMAVMACFVSALSGEHPSM
jgi:hypothetical protein